MTLFMAMFACGLVLGVQGAVCAAIKGPMKPIPVTTFRTTLGVRLPCVSMSHIGQPKDLDGLLDAFKAGRPPPLVPAYLAAADSRFKGSSSPRRLEYGMSALSAAAFSATSNPSRFGSARRCAPTIMCKYADLDELDEFEKARKERLASYCADEHFNDGCDLDDDDRGGEKEQLIRGRAMMYVGALSLVFVVTAVSLPFK